jgi:Bacterial regulatory proteins, luxR family
LFVSVRTVEMHISHAYRKLGIRSRAGLARHVLGGLGGAEPTVGPILEEISPAS